MDLKLFEVAEVLEDGLGEYVRADRADVPKGWRAAAAEQIGDQAGDGQGAIRHDRRVWFWRLSAAGKAERAKAARLELPRGLKAAGRKAVEWLESDDGRALADAAGYARLRPREVLAAIAGGPVGAA